MSSDAGSDRKEAGQRIRRLFSQLQAAQVEAARRAQVKPQSATDSARHNEVKTSVADRPGRQKLKALLQQLGRELKRRPPSQ